MNEKNCCKDENYVNSAKSQLTDDTHIENLSEFFKLFSDKTRLKIIEILHHDEVCVGTIADILDMSQSSVSHQLRILKRSRLVKSRKEGKWVFYSLCDDHVRTVFAMGLDHILEN